MVFGVFSGMQDALDVSGVVSMIAKAGWHGTIS